MSTVVCILRSLYMVPGQVDSVLVGPTCKIYPEVQPSGECIWLVPGTCLSKLTSTKPSSDPLLSCPATITCFRYMQQEARASYTTRPQKSFTRDGLHAAEILLTWVKSRSSGLRQLTSALCTAVRRHR